jgi:antitoxin component of MazEF toxin-antitoxin module
MKHLTVKVKKWKDSFGIIIPKQAVDELGISADEVLDVEIVKKRRRSGFGICRGASPYKEEEEPHADLW